MNRGTFLVKSLTKRVLEEAENQEVPLCEKTDIRIDLSEQSG